MGKDRRNLYSRVISGAAIGILTVVVLAGCKPIEAPPPPPPPAAEATDTSVLSAELQAFVDSLEASGAQNGILLLEGGKLPDGSGLSPELFNALQANHVLALPVHDAGFSESSVTFTIPESWFEENIGSLSGTLEWQGSGRLGSGMGLGLGTPEVTIPEAGGDPT